jgi:hypothetical protein
LEVGIHVLRGHQTTLARQHARLQTVQPDTIRADDPDTSDDDGFVDITQER